MVYKLTPLPREAGQRIRGEAWMGETLRMRPAGNVRWSGHESEALARTAERWVRQFKPRTAPRIGQISPATDPGWTVATGKPVAVGTMEQQGHDRMDAASMRAQGPEHAGAQESDNRTEMMSRAKRDQALAWVQAYQLIRGGVVDEVVEFIEGSQLTIEILLQMLRDAACCRDQSEPAAACDFCQRRDALLAELA